MDAKLDLSTFWCWQKDRPDYGKMDAENIVLKEIKETLIKAYDQ